jgi:hypothetical protein
MKLFRADTLELERLSNKLLDAAFEPSARDIAMTRQIDDAQSRMPARQLLPSLDAAVVLAGSNLELLQLVARTTAYKRKRGEQKKRTRDYSPVRRAVLEDLLFEINLLRQLWKLNGIKIAADRTRGGGLKEVALNIVLRRHFINEDDQLKSQLVTFDKNRAHRRRR